MKATVVALDPVVAKVYEIYPSTFCISSYSNGETRLAVTTFIVLGIWFLLFLLLTYIKFIIKRSNLTSATMKLQFMLFKSLYYQMISVSFCIVIPSLAIFVAPMLGMRNSPTISIFSFLLAIAHTPCDAFLILYFIKPYRNYVVERWSGKKITKVENSSEQVKSIS